MTVKSCKNVHAVQCCLWSVRNLVKGSKLKVPNVRQFVHSNLSYTKFTPVTRKIKRMKAFARFRNEVWCMNLAYVDKLAKNSNGVKYLVVHQDLFERTADTKWMKTKDSRETVSTFFTRITKRKWPKNNRVDKGRNLLEKIIFLSKLKDYKLAPHWVRQRPHLLNVNYDPWKIHFVLTWQNMDTSIFTNCLSSSEHWIPESFARLTWYQKNSTNPTFCTFCTACH